MESHVKIVGGLYVVFGVIFALIGVVILLMVGGAGVVSGDETAMFVTGTIGIVVCGLFFIMAATMIAAGIGVQRYREWGRILTIALSALNLLNFPFGTALGVYALWVMLNNETAALFAQRPAAVHP
jgi:hypothetical protein